MFLPLIVHLLTMSDQVLVSACLSVCPPSTSTLFPVSSTISLYVDYTLFLSFELSHKFSSSSHTIITLPKNLNLLTYKGLVIKSVNILPVRQCLDFIFPCFTLLASQYNLIPVCLDFIEHEFFPFLVFFYAASLSCHKMFDFIGYPCASRNFSYQFSYVRYSLLPITFSFFNF